MKLNYLVLASVLASACAFAGCGNDNTGRGNEASATSASGTAPVATGPLAEGGFRANITVGNPPNQLAPSESVTLSVKVKNTGTAVWPIGGRRGDGFFQLNLGDHWKDNEGKEVKIDDRVAMPNAVGPGQEVERALVVKAPDKPGDYILEIDMVQEGVAWFAQKGSEPLKLKIKVANRSN